MMNEDKEIAGIVAGFLVRMSTLLGMLKSKYKRELDELEDIIAWEY
jgi:hypothetical protein